MCKKAMSSEARAGAGAVARAGSRKQMLGAGAAPKQAGSEALLLTLVDLTPMWLSSSDTRGLNLQQEPSLETKV